MLTIKNITTKGVALVKLETNEVIKKHNIKSC